LTTELRIAQADWDDPMDGSGPSGKTVDWSLAQIFGMDLQFLGVGRVRFYLDIDGLLIQLHAINNANSNAVQPYMRTANLPVRYEALNTGTAGGVTAFGAICARVASEGGGSIREMQYNASNGVTGINLTTTLTPVLSIRPGPAFDGQVNRGWIVPQAVSLFATGNNNVQYEVWWNAELTGASWTPVNTNAMGEFDVSATALNTSNAVRIHSDYVPVASGKAANNLANVFSARPLVNSFDGTTPDHITIAARTLGGTGVGYATISWFGQW
jgi:hypothetical protein